MGLVGWVYSMTFKENKKPKGEGEGNTNNKFGGFFCVWETLCMLRRYESFGN
jgi:hypothetical protein